MQTQTVQMTIQAAAAHLNVSEKTIRRWIKNGRLKASKINKRWQVCVEVDAAVDADQTAVQHREDEPVLQMRTEIKYLREMLDRKDTQIDQQNQLIAMTAQQNGQLLNQRPAPRRSMGERVGRWVARLREAVASL